MGLCKDLNEINKKKFKTFVRFLKDKNVYNAFFKNITRNKEDTENSFAWVYGGDLIRFFSECSYRDWTTSCFIWCKQPEGEIFWCNLHTEWSSKCEKLYEIQWKQK